MVTIQRLEVHFDVEGNEEEQVFVQMFNKCIGEWERRRTEERRIQKSMTRSRLLGDRTPQESDS